VSIGNQSGPSRKDDPLLAEVLSAYAAGGHLSVAEDLLTMGANANLRNEFGDTALEMATKAGNSKMAKLVRRYMRKS
jgi:ankyrin repeat protein